MAETPKFIMGETLGSNERWADRFPELGEEEVNYESMISPDFYEVEREAVFRRRWLHVGYEADIRSAGEYFTKELEVLKTSLLVVRGRDNKVRAFHNTCPHRGNRLVWDDNPRTETNGKCLRFSCKYHGLGFGLDGKIDKLPQEKDWFGDQGTSMSLSEVPIESWNGLLFTNFSPGGPTESLRKFLGERVWNLYGNFPFDKLTQRTLYRGDCASNWKPLKDAFSEGFHGVTLHASAFPMFKNMDVEFHSLAFDFDGPHGVWTTGRVPEGHYSFDIERLAEALPTGSTRVGPEDLRILPESIIPDPDMEWGVHTLNLYPNTAIQIYYPGWVMIYNYWPCAYNKMRFESELFYQPARNFSDLFSQKTGSALVADALLQDFNTLEATQLGLEARAFEHYPLMDEEILIRHFHQQIYDDVEAYRNQTSAGARS